MRNVISFRLVMMPFLTNASNLRDAEQVLFRGKLCLSAFWSELPPCLLVVSLRYSLARFFVYRVRTCQLFVERLDSLIPRSCPRRHDFSKISLRNSLPRRRGDREGELIISPGRPNPSSQQPQPNLALRQPVLRSKPRFHPRGGGSSHPHPGLASLPMDTPNNLRPQHGPHEQLKCHFGQLTG